MGRKPVSTATTAEERLLRMRTDEDILLWLRDRAQRVGDSEQEDSPSVQAKTELRLWHTALAGELAGITLTLAQARAVAEAIGGPRMRPAISAAGSIPSVYAACFDAFRAARRGPYPDMSSYAAQHGIDEPALLAYLAGLGPAADHALHDAISRFWADPHCEPTAEGFAAAGLRVTG